MCFLDCKLQHIIVIVYLLTILCCDYNFIAHNISFIFLECNLIINYDKIQMEYLHFINIFVYPTLCGLESSSQQMGCNWLNGLKGVYICCEIQEGYFCVCCSDTLETYSK
jgi:hypothetical protein